MQFHVLPILETMLQFYQQPRTIDRFKAYLTLLQGETKGDLVLPISGFNPMGKEHVLDKLMELKTLNIEHIISNTIKEINSKQLNKNGLIFKVAFNLSDDLMGAWTNRFTTDYENKFKLNALIKRNFCTPIFWTSENYSEKLIIDRTLEYCYRTVYWLSNPNPKTLAEHILQEVNIARETKPTIEAGNNFEILSNFFQTNKNSSNYFIIFNFLYGDDAIASLGNNPLGVKVALAGFKFAKWMATNEFSV